MKSPSRVWITWAKAPGNTKARHNVATEIEKFRFRIIAAVIIAIKKVATTEIEKSKSRMIVFLAYNVATESEKVRFRIIAFH